MAENNTPPEIPERGTHGIPGTKGIQTKPGCNNVKSKIDCKERIPVLSEIDDSDVIDLLEYLLRKARTAKNKVQVAPTDVLQFFKCDNDADGANDKCVAFLTDNARTMTRFGLSKPAVIQGATIDLENARNDLLMIINKHKDEIESLNKKSVSIEERRRILQKLSNTFYNEKQNLKTKIKDISGKLNTPVNPLTGEDKGKASALARNILENLINLKDISVDPLEQGVELGPPLEGLPNKEGGKRKRRNSQKKKKNKSNRKKQRKSKASRKKKRN